MPRLQIWDACASGVLVELLFYISHRLLHTRHLYRFHKLHHAYKAPIALAALYAHPLEVAVGNTIAVMAPAYIVGIHAYSWMWGVALGFVSTQAHHCGFDLDGVAHDRHHQYSNVEFGHLGVMDYVCVLRARCRPRCVTCILLLRCMLPLRDSCFAAAAHATDTRSSLSPCAPHDTLLHADQP